MKLLIEFDEKGIRNCLPICETDKETEKTLSVFQAIERAIKDHFKSFTEDTPGK